MLYSKLFGKTRFDAPHDADSTNAKLLVQGGFVEKLSAGIYQFLPLGLRVMKKINQIIREEMDRVGGQEILMASLHPIEIWQQTGRDKTMTDILYRTKTSSDKEFVLGPSHEETVTPLAKKYVQSYKDLPFAVYQIQTKFRDEPRAKSGLLRGREFGMKDMYSFHEDQEDFDRFYEITKQAYFQVFKRCGLTAKVTEAAGGSFSDKLSYEFMVLTDAGEDVIVYCSECTHCANSEVSKVPEGGTCPKCKKGTLSKAKAAEVGNVFDLGQKYPKSFNFSYKDKEGNEKMPIVGCYGIGTTRLMGTIVEVFSDEKGIVWPESIGPFQVHLISLASGDGETKKASEMLYKNLMDKGVEVLYDDRDVRAGEKFADSDLLGIPWRLVVSDKTVKAGGIEIKNRKEAASKIVSESEAMKIIGK